MKDNMQGVRLRHWPGPPALKRLIGKSLARRDLVSYEIVEPPPAAASEAARPVEKRVASRRRVRLRSAKLLDPQNKFICECLVRDRSPQGLCLKLMKNIGLPNRYRLYDDETDSLSEVVTMWRREALLGVRYCLTEKPIAIKESDRAALRGRYYAMPD